VKSKILRLILLLTVVACGVRAASTNAAGDSIKVIDKSFVGAKKSPGATNLGTIAIRIQIEAILKSMKSATLRAGATLENEREIVTLFTRSIKEGRTETEFPLAIKNFKGKSLVVVVWIDPNPEETKSPPRPIVFERFGFNLSDI
jgi:hypothetical protein